MNLVNLLESVIQSLIISGNSVFFWSSHSYAEIDLFCLIKSKRVGFEIKFSDSPSLTNSMKIAMKDLGNEKA